MSRMAIRLRTASFAMLLGLGASNAFAQQIGNPKAVRAVGAANGRNPISIIAPCHRVIGASGGLTGFAGGLEAKQYLLTLEGTGQAELVF
jgi:methylated-DNA-[protein]-cysteine S-methyltransferase